MVDLNYQELILHYSEWLPYAVRYSDSLAVITKQVKPYSVIPPKSVHDPLLEPLRNYLLDFQAGVREWPGMETRTRHLLLLRYQCRREILPHLLKLPNLMVFGLDHPEDLHFYRGGQPWFASVTHEKMAFLQHETKEDVKMFASLSDE